MKNIIAFLVILLLFLSSTAIAEEINVQGFLKIEDVKSSRPDLPKPVIPKDWKFMGVSNGARQNSNNLWFQDKEGNIFMLQGDSDGLSFILKPIISRISVK
jgi:hypothetical protein